MGLQIKISPADRWFSLFIRELADNKCEYCGNAGESIQNSHFYGRRAENTRFEPDNCIAVCFYHHQMLGSDDREAYRDFMIKKLGEKRFKTLRIQYNTYKKRDRKLEVIKWKKAYHDLCEEKKVILRA